MYIDLANDPVKPASFAGEPLEGLRFLPCKT